MTPRPHGNRDRDTSQQHEPQDNQLVRANLQPPLRAAMENGGRDEAEEGNEQQQQQPQPQQRQYLAIQDETEWLRQYGLHGEPHYGAESYANQQEAKDRIKASDEYQKEIHARLFEAENKHEYQRRRKLNEWSDQVVKIHTASDAFVECNLRHLASFSDTVFAMAECRPHFQSDDSVPVEISLQEYSHEAVVHFCGLLEAIKNPSDFSTVKPKDDYAVDCCRIASYLQCNSLLDEMLVPLLVESVDSENCLSLCQLADQLSLPSLLEKSVNQMVNSLKSIKDNEIYQDLSPELQGQIEGIQKILKSSNRRKVFFSSFEEYLALFAEQVDYYRERLETAIHQQGELRVHTQGWQYAQAKIDQQRERVRVLNLVLDEQKRVFRK